MLLGFALLLPSIEAAIRLVNLRHLKLHGSEVPSGFEGLVDKATLGQMSAYARDSGWLSLASHLVSQALIVTSRKRLLCFKC